jgi:hypothetical protein
MGETSAVRPSDDGGPHELVRAHPTRWTLPAVACVLALSDVGRDRTLDEWEAALDQVDRIVRALL